MNKYVYLSRRVEFSASHVYHNPAFTTEENRRVFGKCNNPNGHGHNYTLEVTVKGEVNGDTGFVLDLKDLKDILNSEVMDVFDHRHLNKEVPEFATEIPTTENIAISIWNRVAPNLNSGTQMHRVRVYETPDLFVDYYGEP
ncbi:MAG TPA: 6-carboxytetrahydropterin synthase [Terriglobales bacterium]|nr:6-carboxytetrahydropterin synthase [Terriglobales bacterium]